MRRATLTLTTAAAATAALALLLRPADALNVFSRTQRHRQAKEMVAIAVEEGPTSYTQDHNRTLAIHGYGNGSAGVAAFDIGCVACPRIA